MSTATTRAGWLRDALLASDKPSSYTDVTHTRLWLHLALAWLSHGTALLLMASTTDLYILATDDLGRSYYAWQWWSEKTLFTHNLIWLPLQFIVGGPLARLLGGTYIALLLMNLVANLICVAGLLMLGRAAFGEQQGLAAALLAGTLPLFIAMGLGHMNEPLDLAALAWLLWGWVRWWKDNSALGLAVTAVAGLAGVMTRYETWPLLALVTAHVGLMTLLRRRRLVWSVGLFVLPWAFIGAWTFASFQWEKNNPPLPGGWAPQLVLMATRLNLPFPPHSSSPLGQEDPTLRLKRQTLPGRVFSSAREVAHHGWAIIVLAAVGIWLHRKNSAAWLLSTMAAVSLGLIFLLDSKGVIPSIFSGRRFLPGLIILTPLAGAAVVELVKLLPRIHQAVVLALLLGLSIFTGGGLTYPVEGPPDWGYMNGLRHRSDLWRQADAIYFLEPFPGWLDISNLLLATPVITDHKVPIRPVYAHEVPTWQPPEGERVLIIGTACPFGEPAPISGGMLMLCKAF